MSPLPLAIARVCHEANRALQIIQADPGIAVSPPWDECSTELQESVLSGVHGVLQGNSPEQSHEGWCEFKRSRGWIYGPVKDETIRTHPCLVPYGDLPAEQRMKDTLFHAVVTALASSP